MPIDHVTGTGPSEPLQLKVRARAGVAAAGRIAGIAVKMCPFAGAGKRWPACDAVTRNEEPAVWARSPEQLFLDGCWGVEVVDGNIK